jgi:competence protein ComGC
VQVQRIKPTLKRRKSKRAFANGNALLVLVLVILLLLVLGLWFYPNLTKSMVGATVAKLKSVL